MGLVDFKAQRYAAADEHFKSASANPIGELTSTLARAWLYQAQDKTQEALALLDAPKQPDWAQYYLRYHRALLADQAGRRAEARAAYERIPKNDQRTLRITLAYARHAGQRRRCQAGAERAQGALRADQERRASRSRGRCRSRSRPASARSCSSRRPTEGMAEAFYGLGEALTGEGGVGVGAVYLQFALYLAPNSAFALAALANAYETTKRYEDAIAAYDRIPKGTPLQMSIDIRKALNLNQLERIDEAQKLLDEIARDKPQGHPPAGRAGQHHARAQALCRGGRLLHARHRPHRQARAEALVLLLLARHLLRAGEEVAAGRGRPAEALQLSAEQAMVLNYLGYSWIDQNRNLKQGLALIEKAVRQKPDDGYIVDSLGWAYYRHGQLQGSREAPGARGGAAARGPGAQRSPGRCLLARAARARGALPVGPGADARSPSRKTPTRSRRSCRRACLPPAQARQVKRTKEVQKRPEKGKKSSEVTQPSFPQFNN